MPTLPGTNANSTSEHQDWRPSVNPWLPACSVMLATFMVVLDSSVANVALPHIAGTLSASNDESTWVLTSYLVANAIMLPVSVWLARRIGRSRLLLLSITLFTLASLLCGMSLSMPMLVVARVLQGLGGGGMQPLAQSVLLESFPPEQHGTAMAVYSVGVIVAPIIGPTLGGWITDSFSWRWIFYINLPFGLLALFMVNLYVEDPPYLRQRIRGAIDGVGLTLMVLWLGSLQLLLDKGQEADWFGATWIRWATAITVCSLIGFVLRELHTPNPIVHLRILTDRNFCLGTAITAIYGFILYGATAMLPLYLQTLMGYSAMQSGMTVSPRGIGAMTSTILAGMLVRKIDGRLMICFGFLVMASSIWMLSLINLDIGMSSVIVPNMLNGFAMGFIFVPLTTLSLGLLPKSKIGNASGIYNLMRNLGGSVGIAMITTLLVRHTQVHQSDLAAASSGQSMFASTAGALGRRIASSGVDPVTAQHKAWGMLYRSAQQQASLLSYTDVFRLLALLSLLCIPMALAMRRGGAQAAKPEVADK
jgi:DHA2 family multidrug resistance protein